MLFLILILILTLTDPTDIIPMRSLVSKLAIIGRRVAGLVGGALANLKLFLTLGSRTTSIMIHVQRGQHYLPNTNKLTTLQTKHRRTVTLHNTSPSEATKTSQQKKIAWPSFQGCADTAF